MSARTQYEAGRFFFVLSCLQIGLWNIAALIYCCVTHTWPSINNGTEAFGMALAVSVYLMVVGGAFWFVGWRSCKRQQARERTA